MIAQVFDDVAAQLAADSVTATHVFGTAETFAQGEPPRIVWVRQPSTFGPPARIGGNPVSLRTWRVGWAAICWAKAPPQADLARQALENYDAAAALAHNFIRALHRVALGSYELEGEEQIEDASTVVHGVALAVRFAIHVPIVDATLAWAPPDAVVKHVGKMIFSSGQEVTGCAAP